MSIPRFFGLLWGGAALLITPPVAGLLFALEPLHDDDVVPLWTCCGALLAFSVWLFANRPGPRRQIAALSLPFLATLVVELVIRLVLIHFAAANTTNDLIRLARRTYPDTAAFQGSAFLQFTGKPNRELIGNRALGNLDPFNDLGFIGPIYDRVKPENTLRVMCLGGSTTARGYPKLLAEQLTAAIAPAKAEAMNLALGWYTSAHSTVNFVLNGVGYSPDYVVFHHAWNDERARGWRAETRGDYSHAFKTFEPARIPDALLIRGSVIYRWGKDRLFGEPVWAFLSTALLRQDAARSDARFADVTELIPYADNVRTVVDVALARGIVPVLTTQPHTTDSSVEGFPITVHIDQCNEVMRKIAARYGDRVLFVDLAERFTGRNELFIDLGHMTDEGMTLKAHLIGDAILAHLAASGGGR